jgi:tRNAThr (cytosine32-N3)-methyltransferase
MFFGGITERYNEHPERQWNKFYAHNANNFFKNRKWLHQEFPILRRVTQEDSPATVLLEVGAGAGNTAFPILKLNKNPRLTIHACDFSKTAIDVIRGHEEYRNAENIGGLEASVWDAAAVSGTGEEYSLPEGIEPGTVDVLIMVFIFSALSPEQWVQAVRNIWHALKPGGVVLFRDYGRGDLAQVRFKKGRWMGDNFYVRGDGTRVYFFDEEELRATWGGAGFEIESFGVDRRMLVNRQRRLKMYRCWMQAVFRKPLEKDTDAVEEGDAGPLDPTMEMASRNLAATSISERTA